MLSRQWWHQLQLKNLVSMVILQCFIFWNVRLWAQLHFHRLSVLIDFLAISCSNPFLHRYPRIPQRFFTSIQSCQCISIQMSSILYPPLIPSSCPLTISQNHSSDISVPCVSYLACSTKTVLLFSQFVLRISPCCLPPLS